jgi:hypothetical protein
MPPKPSSSFVGRVGAWAVSVTFGRRGPASREHFRLSGGLGEKSRFRGRKARSGEDLVMAKGPFGGVPTPPEPTPLDSAPSRLGGYLHHMRVWDPLEGSYGHAQAISDHTVIMLHVCGPKRRLVGRATCMQGRNWRGRFHRVGLGLLDEGMKSGGGDVEVNT